MGGAGWRLSTKRPADGAGGSGRPVAGRSGDKPQPGFRLTDRLADNPPKLDGPRIEHLALLRYPDARGEVVDLAGDGGQRLAVLVLAS